MDKSQIKKTAKEAENSDLYVHCSDIGPTLQINCYMLATAEASVKIQNKER